MKKITISSTKMNQTKLLFVLIFLLHLRTILTKEEDVDRSQSCSKYLNKTHLQGLEPKIQEKICDMLLRDLYNNSQNFDQRTYKKPSQYEVWGYGFIMVTFIR